MHPQTASWLQDLASLDSDDDALEIQPTETPKAIERSPCTFSFTSLPTEVVVGIIETLTLPATASFLQTSKHLRSLCMHVHTWKAHSGDFRPVSDRATTHYRLPHSQSSSPKQKADDDQHVTPAQLAQLADSQRYSWCPGPGELYARRQFSTGTKVVEPAWLSLMPQVSSRGSTWLYVKTKTLAETALRGCSSSFQHTHNSVRPQLYSLWLTGEAKDGLLLQRMLLKLTRLSWSKTYETIGNAFTHVADCIALDLRTDFLASDQPAQQTQLCNDTTLIWKAILRDWGDYKAWVTKVCSLGVRLGECISAERAAEMMSRGKADTPNLFDVGRGAFRSQVILAYGLRSMLQNTWRQLRIAAKLNSQSADDAHVMLDVTRLLQELDVADDGTRPSTHHTQEQMREAFGLQEYRHEFARTLLQLK